MRLGVLSWEKLKNRETYGRIVSFELVSLTEIVALETFESLSSPTLPICPNCFNSPSASS